MSNVIVRRAGREDANKLLTLITALADYEKLDPPDEGARSRLVEDGWGPKPRYQAWLAELDGKAVGYAILFDTYSTFLAQPTLYLEDLFLLPEYRGKGIGDALFRRVAQIVLDEGYGRMEWVCLDWNQAGLKFYDKMGARNMTEWLTFRLLPEQIRDLTPRPPSLETSS